MKLIAKLLMLGAIFIATWGCALNDKLEIEFVQGTVKNGMDYTPLQGVTVEIETLSKTYYTETDDTGKFEFNNLDRGLAILRFSKDGYTPFSRNIVLNSPTLILVNVVMYNPKN
ncbi:hypothetical protein D0T50_00235 [Bacteroides sp. 214]|uniref:carboxypeptidase regulatory-like domain-containing protein n=1 Tax=Bacteroides sp. 214 TaxID=2302935 RepID=UPI0013D56911|nr:carboxypeptidase regulatory-like domain-containing protein [Bacteroides sp. 214]NDW11316.1 hypothetical protein [Bacteroides sp. 214]